MFNFWRKKGKPTMIIDSVPGFPVTLKRALDEYNTSVNPEPYAKLIQKKYGVHKAVLVLDLTGFTLTTKTKGVIHFLSLVRKFQHMVNKFAPLYGGTVVKFFADTAMIVFTYPDDAISMSIKLAYHLKQYNYQQPPFDQIHITAGIESGDILMVEERDIFGDAVNIASKLGQDLSNKNEILLGPTAYQELVKYKSNLVQINYETSSVVVFAYKMVLKD